MDARSKLGRAAAALLLAVVASCGGTELAKVPSLLVTVTFDADVQIDQLRFEIVRGTTSLITPAVRPESAAGPLASGASVAILLPNTVVGQTVSVRVTGIFAGSDVISGRSDDIIALPDRSVAVSVQLGRRLIALSVSPNTVSTPIGLAQQINAQGMFSDGSTEDVTDQASWTTGDANLATVDDTPGTRGLVTGKATGEVIITAALGGYTADSRVTVTPVKLISISVTPNPLLLPLGAVRSLKATATFSDRSTADITETAEWTTTDPNVATVGNGTTDKGIVGSVQVGSVTISATKNGVTGSGAVAVVVPALMQIIVEPTSAQIAAGFTRRFFATGIYTDGSREDLTSSVTWSTDDNAKATISNDAVSRGLVTAVAPGAVAILAEKGNGTTIIKGQIAATVTAATLLSMSVTPINPTVPKGAIVDFEATGTYSDGSTQDLTDQVTWSVNPSGLAAIDNSVDHGAANTMASSMGTGTVTATLGSTMASTQLTVSAATLESIMVTPIHPMIAKGTTVTLTAVGTFSDGSTLPLTNQVTWASSSTSCTLQGAVVTGAMVGDCPITASLMAKTGGTTVTVTTATLQTVTVTPAAPSLALGTTRPLVATGTYSDGSTQPLTDVATWTSADANIVAVGNSTGSQGLLTAKAVGSAQITATAMGVQGKVTATVTPATLQSITVTPANSGLPNGQSQGFIATGSYSDGTTQPLTTQVVWSSSNEAVALISNQAGSRGVARGVGVGATTIQAAFTNSSGTVTGQTMLNVTDAVLTSITIEPTSASIALGTSLQLAATGHYSDNTTRPMTTTVSWSSNNEAAAQVSNGAADKGKVSSIAEGMATISAKSGMITGTAMITVSAATLDSITIEPANASAVVGTSVKLRAWGHYSNATMQELTTQVTWGTTDSGVAQISNAVDSKGEITALSAGTVTVNASHASGAVGTTLFTSRAVTLVSIAIEPETFSIAAGQSKKFKATGTYSNNTTQVITTDVNWQSSDDSIAGISNVDGEEGIATGGMMGDVTITATLNGVTGMAMLTVTAPLLSSISIEAMTSSDPTVLVSETIALFATGHYSNFSVKDITNDATWTSLDETIATVDDADAKGLCTGVGEGSVEIHATLDMIEGVTSVLVLQPN